jgi:hypothetical protein
MQESNGEDTTDTYTEKIEYLQYMMFSPGDVIRNKGRYDKATPEDRYIIEEVLGRNKKVADDTVNALRELGYDIERTRNSGNGKQGELNKVDQDNALNTYTGENSTIKSKKGIRVVGDVDVAKFSNELLMTIKKIANVISTTLMPLAQKMYDTRFQGISLHDKNVIIPQLYQDMDEKMYILTSLNNQNNVQLIKLDKDFDKLYNLVKNGLDMYLMPTGGSMTGGHVRSATNYLYEL